MWQLFSNFKRAWIEGETKFKGDKFRAKRGEKSAEVDNEFYVRLK
jgi:hypothetical protein